MNHFLLGISQGILSCLASCNWRQWHRLPVFLLRRGKGAGKVAFFMSADKVKFRKPVVPGDQLIIKSTLDKVRGNKLATANVSCYVDDKEVSSANLMFTIANAGASD